LRHDRRHNELLSPLFITDNNQKSVVVGDKPLNLNVMVLFNVVRYPS